MKIFCSEYMHFYKKKSMGLVLDNNFNYLVNFIL